MAPEPMGVDADQLINVAAQLVSSVGDIPEAPAPLSVTGTDPLSQAIKSAAPKLEEPVQTGLPALKTAALKTATDMGEAGKKYQQADDELARQIKERTGHPPGEGAGASGSGAGAAGAGAAGAAGAGAGGGAAGAGAAGAGAAAAEAAGGGAGAGGAGGMDQLGQLMGMPMQAMGQLGSLPQSMMQGVQQMAQMGGGAKGDKPEKPGEAEEKAKADEQKKAEEPKKAGAAPAQSKGGERAPVAPAHPAPAAPTRPAEPAPSIRL